MNYLSKTYLLPCYAILLATLLLSCQDPDENSGGGGGVSGNTVNFEVAIPPLSKTVTDYLISSANGQHVYAGIGTVNPDWYYSSNAGNTWEAYNLPDYNEIYAVGNNGMLIARDNNKLVRVVNGQQEILDGNMQRYHSAKITNDNKVFTNVGDNHWKAIPMGQTTAPKVQRFGQDASPGTFLGLTGDGKAIFNPKDTLLIYDINNQSWETQYFKVPSEATDYVNEGVNNLSKFTQTSYQLDGHIYVLGVKGFVSYSMNGVERKRSHWPDSRTLPSNSTSTTDKHIAVDGGGNLYVGLTNFFENNNRNVLYRFKNNEWELLVGPQENLPSKMRGNVAEHLNGSYHLGQHNIEPFIGIASSDETGSLLNVSSIEGSQNVSYNGFYPVNDTKMLVSTGRYLYEYTIGTGNWQFKDSLGFNYIGKLPNGNLLAQGVDAAGTHNGHYQSTNDGQTWTPISNSFETDGANEDWFIVKIDELKDVGFLMVACSTFTRFDGFTASNVTDYRYKHFTSTDGETWTEWSRNVMGDHVTAIDNNGIIFSVSIGELNQLSGTIDPDVAYRSNDGGITWNEAGTKAPYSINNNNTLLFPRVSASLPNNKVFLFKQGWEAWESFETDFPNQAGGRVMYQPTASYQRYNGFFGPNNVIYYHTGTTIYRTTGPVN